MKTLENFDKYAKYLPQIDALDDKAEVVYIDVSTKERCIIRASDGKYYVAPYKS